MGRAVRRIRFVLTATAAFLLHIVNSSCLNKVHYHPVNFTDECGVQRPIVFRACEDSNAAACRAGAEQCTVLMMKRRPPVEFRTLEEAKIDQLTNIETDELVLGEESAIIRTRGKTIASTERTTTISTPRTTNDRTNGTTKLARGIFSPTAMLSRQSTPITTTTTTVTKRSTGIPKQKGIPNSWLRWQKNDKDETTENVKLSFSPTTTTMRSSRAIIASTTAIPNKSSKRTTKLIPEAWMLSFIGRKKIIDTADADFYVMDYASGTIQGFGMDSKRSFVVGKAPSQDDFKHPKGGLYRDRPLLCETGGFVTTRGVDYGSEGSSHKRCVIWNEDNGWSEAPELLKFHRSGAAVANFLDTVWFIGGLNFKNVVSSIMDITGINMALSNFGEQR